MPLVITCNPKEKIVVKTDRGDLTIRVKVRPPWDNKGWQRAKHNVRLVFHGNHDIQRVEDDDEGNQSCNRDSVRK